MDAFIERLIQKGSPFELQNAVIDGVPCKVFPRGPQTLRDVFLKSASFKEREFIVKDDTRLNFRQALQRGSCLARIFQQEYGVKTGSRVALFMETSPEWAVVFMACCLAGATAVIIPSNAGGQTIRDVLESTNCELSIADCSHFAMLTTMNRACPVLVIATAQHTASTIPDGNTTGSSVFSVFHLNNLPIGENDLCNDTIYSISPDDEALISFTSGTTGKPKGVVLSHRNMTTGLLNMMLGGAIMSFRTAKDKSRKPPANAQPCSILLSPFSHIGGYSQLMLMGYLGGKIVLLPEWDAQHATTLVENEGVRSLCGLSPVMARELFRTNHSTDKLQSLTHLNIYGAVLHRKFIREIADGYPHISIGTGYGMTETCGAISVASGMDLLDSPELGGLVLPSTNVKVASHEGQEVTQGERGEIWVRGAMVTRSYCSSRDAANVVLEDGWLKTGDLGYLDQSGNLYVTGRFDVIRCGERQVLSSELERLVCELDAIDEAVVFGVPSLGQGTRIVATVVPGSTIQTNENELTREVSVCLKDYADNIKVVIMDDFPRTASGKADRAALQLQLADSSINHYQPS
jgi:long-chain acyl-CoA synthetase